jgi:hypothetical protein
MWEQSQGVRMRITSVDDAAGLLTLGFEDADAMAPQSYDETQGGRCRRECEADLTIV